jgi:methionyl-tRNA formyltransferase
MVVVFFGTPEFGVPTLQHLLHSRHTVAGVVTQPDRPRGRGHKVSFAPVKALALEHGVQVIQPERLKPPDVADAIRAWHPDIGVVAAYGRIIPEHLLTIPRLGMINVHASLLPRYRGAAPVHRAVINGDAETGVTIMRVVKELDAGAMFATVVRPIGPDETSEVVEDALSEMGAALLLRVVEDIEAGKARELPQDESQATYAPRLTKEEGLVDWSQSAAQIHNRVRGLYPWPHAYTYLRGHRLILRRTRVPGRAAPDDAAAGAIIAVDHQAVHVATGAGEEVEILEVQPEGRRPMSAREFAAGHRIVSGDVLSSS